MKTEADTGGIQPQVEGCPEPQRLEEAGRTLPRAREGGHYCGPLTSRLCENSSHCSKLPSLWPFAPQPQDTQTQMPGTCACPLGTSDSRSQKDSTASRIYL